MLTLQVKEKEIENLTPEEEFVRGTVGAKCQINFDEFWQSYNKYIVFKRVGYEPINFMVDTLENEIEIPYTILAESGEFKIGVFGITETETLPTLYSKDIKILYGTDTHGTTPPTYIPSEIDQLRLSKQDKLVSSENIKTVNGESVLGSGNIKIQVEVDQIYSPTSTNAQSGKAVAEAVSTEQKRANNTFSNALKGTKSDTAIFLDDISPVTHEMEVKISSDTVTDLTAVKVKRYGSNLFDGNLIPGVYNSTDLDNPVTSGYVPKYQSIKIYLKAGTYTISSSVLIRIVRAIVDGVYKNISAIGKSYTFSATTDGYCGFSFRREDNLNWDSSEKIWINRGSSAIDYEQYALAEYTPNADGTVNGVTSIYPNTTLTTDTDGIIIDCEYNRDINKAFAELQSAIISLGGNV